MLNLCVTCLQFSTFRLSTLQISIPQVNCVYSWSSVTLHLWSLLFFVHSYFSFIFTFSFVLIFFIHSYFSSTLIFSFTLIFRSLLFFCSLLFFRSLLFFVHFIFRSLSFFVHSHFSFTLFFVHSYFSFTLFFVHSYFSSTLIFRPLLFFVSYFSLHKVGMTPDPWTCTNCPLGSWASVCWVRSFPFPAIVTEWLGFRNFAPALQ